MTQPPQDYASHRRYYPLFHFVVLPALIVNIAWATMHAARHPGRWNYWTAAMAVIIALLALTARAMVLTVQNRVIRLEMRLRLASLLAPALAARATALSARQLVALRFAGDDELPTLVERCLAGELTEARDIKLAVRNWQADWLRA